MAGLKPEQVDYNAIVDKADAENFDWGALYESTQDPGFASLAPEHQRHVVDMLRVKAEREHGNRVDPNAKSGKLGAMHQLGQFLKILMPSVGGPGMGGQPGGGVNAIGPALDTREQGVAELINQGKTRAEATEANDAELADAGRDVVQQFGYYFTGGAIPEPEKSKDIYVQDIMENTVKPITSIAAIGTQLVSGWYLLGLVSKVPLISGAASNLSLFTRGMIKGAALDFGINAAWPEGLATENRFGLSDDIARALAPDNVLKEPTGLAGRMLAGVGGAAEGALFGSALYGFGVGVKMADAKYAFSVSPKMMDRVRQSLEAAGVDITGMTRRDVMLTYRTRMTEAVQGLDEAVFNGERLSAESWIAQAFLSDPNIAELTPAEGRLLHGIFSANKGGVSILKGITDPEAALTKLRKVGINVDATVIPRPGVNPAGVSSGDVLVPATEAELDAAVELSDEFASNYERAKARGVVPVSQRTNKQLFEDPSLDEAAKRELIGDDNYETLLKVQDGTASNEVTGVAMMENQSPFLADDVLQKYPQLVDNAEAVGAKNAQTPAVEVGNIVDDIKALGPDMQKVTDFLKARFPQLEGNQPMALADGLIGNQDWAVAKLEELRSGTPQVRGTGEQTGSVVEGVSARAEHYDNPTTWYESLPSDYMRNRLVTGELSGDAPAKFADLTPEQQTKITDTWKQTVADVKSVEGTIKSVKQVEGVIARRIQEAEGTTAERMKEIWDGYPPDNRIDMAGKEYGNAKWDDLPDDLKKKFIGHLEEMDVTTSMTPEQRLARIQKNVADKKPRAKRPTKKELKAAETRALNAERRAEDAERKAQTDGLTGLHNQAAWKSAMPRVDADAASEVVSIDLAGFKDVNDQIGHAAGDEVIQSAAQAVSEASRILKGEQVFRTGGDEFVMVVPKGQGQRALQLAQTMFEARVVELTGKVKNLPRIRGGVGMTYKEADAAERGIRDIEKATEKMKLDQKVRETVEKTQDTPGIESAEHVELWNSMTPQQRKGTFGVSDVVAKQNDWNKLRETVREEAVKNMMENRPAVEGSLEAFATSAADQVVDPQIKGWIQNTFERFGKPGEGLYLTEQKVRDDILKMVQRDKSLQGAKQIGIKTELPYLTPPPMHPKDGIFTPKVVAKINELGEFMKELMSKQGRPHSEHFKDLAGRDKIVHDIGEEIGHDELTHYLNKIPANSDSYNGVDEWLFHAWRSTRPETEIRLESAEEFLRYIDDLQSGKVGEAGDYMLNPSMLGGKDYMDVINKLNELGEDGFRAAMQGGELRKEIDKLKNEISELEKIVGKSPQLKPGTFWGPRPEEIQ